MSNSTPSGRTASTRFLDAFSQIESVVREMVDGGRFDGFQHMLKLAAEKRAEVRRHQRDLTQYAELRNAIVHKRRRGGEAIAEPHIEVVEDMERIARVLTAPPRLEALGRTDVCTCDPRWTVQAVAQAMYNGDFSQLPVYEDGACVDLVTSETLARWMGSRLEADGGIILDDTLIGDVLPYRDPSSTHAFLGRGESIAHAIEMFEDAAREGKYLDAVLVTDGGRRTQRPLNILTVYDLPRMGMAASGLGDSA